MADDDVEMVGEVPVAVEEVRKLSPEMEASRLIYCYSTEDRPAEKEALKQSVLQLIEKNGASAALAAFVTRGHGAAHVLAASSAFRSRGAALRDALHSVFVASRRGTRGAPKVCGFLL